MMRSPEASAEKPRYNVHCICSICRCSSVFIRESIVERVKGYARHRQRGRCMWVTSIYRQPEAESGSVSV